MHRQGIKVRDYLQAEGQAALSSLTTLHPSLRQARKRVEPEAPHVSVRWVHARVPASELENRLEREGIWGAGQLPKDYPKAAILAISKREVDNRQRNEGGIHAVAYALHSTVMVGVMEEDHEIFKESPDNRYYQVAMTIGEGALKASAGLWSPDTRKFWAPIAMVECAGIVLVNQITGDEPYHLV